jgi:hypothetical protein
MRKDNEHLKFGRDAQDAIVAISENLTPPPLSEDLQKFVSGLATAWRSGEVRPTHRREPKPRPLVAHAPSPSRALDCVPPRFARPDFVPRQPISEF